MKIFQAILPLLACSVLPAQGVKPKPTEATEKKVVQGKEAQKKGTQGKDVKKQGKDAKPDVKKGEPKPIVRLIDKTKEEIEEEKNPLPRGADPEDLKVMRSAQAMLEAEKKLAKLIKSGKIKGIDKVLPFEEIASWPYENGLKGMPKALNKLDGKTVMMTGFMLPIDEVENIKEFLLVQSLWSCCYGQPPDINGTVRVVMTGKKRIDYKFDPIKVVGKFKIKATVEDGFCVDIYQLETQNVEVIQ